METIIQSKGSHVRCYKCGSPDINSVCHHCGRPMCTKHGPIKPILSWFTENREFNRLSLSSWPLLYTEGAHCEHHVHSKLNYRRIMIAPGILLVIIGVVLFFLSAIKIGGCFVHQPPTVNIAFNAWAEILRNPKIYDGIKLGACYTPSLFNFLFELLKAASILGFGIWATMAGSKLNRESIDSDAKAQGITLPVGPISNNIRITETIHAHIKVDENGLATSQILGNPQGEIAPAFQFSAKDIRRVKEYKSKYHITSDDNLSFQGGYLLLKGDPFIRIISENGKPNINAIDPDQLYHSTAVNLLRLDGQVHKHDFLLEKTGRSNSAWPRSWTYKIEDALKDKSKSRLDPASSPVWVMPVLVERGNTKVLALVVQLHTEFFPNLNEVLESGDLRPEKKVWIERLKLNLSHLDFGHPKVNGAIVSEALDETQVKKYEIEWHGVFFNEKNRSGNILVYEGFNMLFNKELSPNAHLRGSLIIRVPGLISTVRNVQYYSALGHHVYSRQNNREEVSQTSFTYLHVDLDIALAKMSLANFVSIPCKFFEIPGAPTPRRLNHILNTFHSEIYSHNHQIFIYSVKESQPQLGDENSQTGRWHWQIYGKQYHDLTPIDFHIVMYGHGSQGQNGQTRIEASINATVDENTYALVQKTKADIEAILNDAIKSEPG